MEDLATDGTETSDHPEPEELAAFVDGYLSEDRCARIRRHLGRCEDCYEIFMETVRFQEETGAEHTDEIGQAAKTGENVLPFTTERNRRISRWVSAAAAVVAVMVLGPTVYHALTRPSAVGPEASAPMSVEALVSTFPPGAAKQFRPPVKRGPGELSIAASEIAVRLGVELFDLQLALRDGQEEEARFAAGRIAELLTSAGADSELTHFYREIHDGRGPLAPGLAQQAALRSKGFSTYVPDLDTFYFGFGQWVEAGYAASSLGQGELFTRPEVRDYLDRIRREKGEQLLADGVDENLSKIAGLVARQPLSSADYSSLETSFQRILRVYYNLS